MRKAMAEAEVGDDVYGEDPTVRRLEERAAELLGHEAALFVPSGTMGNQIALHVQTRPGDEVIIEGRCALLALRVGRDGRARRPPAAPGRRRPRAGSPPGVRSPRIKPECRLPRRARGPRAREHAQPRGRPS